MANIKYTDKSGEHKGTLTLKEYYMLAFGYDEHTANQAVGLLSRGWHDTDYEPFKRAVSKKYSTEVESAILL